LVANTVEAVNTKGYQEVLRDLAHRDTFR